jgi:hypothetical protein
VANWEEKESHKLHKYTLQSQYAAGLGLDKFKDKHILQAD